VFSSLINDVSLVKKSSVAVYASIYKFEGQVSVFNYKNDQVTLLISKGGVECVIQIVLLEFYVLPNTLGALKLPEVLKIILK
jgi:adenylyltransferase/sulfurtransferase